MQMAMLRLWFVHILAEYSVWAQDARRKFWAIQWSTKAFPAIQMLELKNWSELSFHLNCFAPVWALKIVDEFYLVNIWG